MGLAVARERKLWTRERLTELGTERAVFWGWPNIYTYTKSLGEQLVAAETDIVRAIVRPSIVESAKDFPFPGWNEGFTTTAPLIFIALKGQQQIPVNDKLILDITPVDQVAAVMLGAAAEAIAGEPRLVYQAATGDTNPNTMERIVSLVGLYKRKHYQEKETGFKLLNEFVARMENKPVTPARFNAMSTPMVNSAAKQASSLLDRVRPRWGGGKLTHIVDRAKATVERVEEVTRETKEAFDMFRPFMIENAYIFRADNVRSLFARGARGRAAAAPLGPGDVRLVRLLDERPLPRPEEVGLPDARRGHARAAEARLHLPRPARTLRDFGQALLDARRHAHRARRAEGAVHLRRHPGTRDARRRLLRRARA